MSGAASIREGADGRSDPSRPRGMGTARCCVVAQLGSAYCSNMLLTHCQIRHPEPPRTSHLESPPDCEHGHAACWRTTAAAMGRCVTHRSCSAPAVLAADVGRDIGVLFR